MVWRKVRTFAELVRYEHTVFALPFAYLGAFLAAGGIPSAAQLFWITAAMLGARSAAMGFNRLIDRAIDARNPRTARRHLPRGLVNAAEVLAFSLASLVLLVLAAFMLNPACVRYLPLVVPALVIYPYTKRFTWGCHFFLAAAQFFAPFGGWVAVTGRADLPAILLGVAVGLWVAGFDIIYALQDLDFDRREGIFSLPARFGPAPALWISRGLHLVVWLLFLSVWALLDRGPLFLAGITVAGALLAYEQYLVRPDDFSRVDAAFFNVNGLISLLLFLFTVLDLVARPG